MIRKALNRDPNPGGMILISLGIHLAVAFVCSRTAIFKPVLHETKAYYVDIVSLPTLEPAAASPQPSSAPAAAAPAAIPPPPAAKPAMALPAKTSAPTRTSPPAAQPQDTREQESREFAQRLNRLERNSEAQHQAEALAALQKKAADKKGQGGPATATGDKGVDYGAYIQSRLRDALATTMVYRSKAPEAAVRIYIDKNGRVIRAVMERPSADKLFNDSVMRTIEKAKVNFPPTPTGTGFDKLFVFSPLEGIR
jgi:colicin import membrane protein